MRRETVNRWTVAQHIAAIEQAADEAQHKEMAKAMESISPWELYKAEGLFSNINRICIDGPVNFALRTLNTLLPVRQAMRIMLGTGQVLFFDVTGEDGELEIQFEEPERIDYIRWKSRWGKPDEPIEVIIRYEYDSDGRYESDYSPTDGIWSQEQYAPHPSSPNYAFSQGTDSESPGPDETWVYRAHYYYMGLPSEDEEEEGDPVLLRTPVVDVRRYKLEDEEEELKKPDNITRLESWPYRGVRWETGESVISPLRLTILRIEQCVRNIGNENDLHSRRSIVYRGVDEVNVGKRESNEAGHTKIPIGSDAFYPDMHSEGMDPMFREWEMLMEEVREVVGTLKPKELHNASGPSRTFEIYPNVALAQVIRDRAQAVVDLLSPETKLHMGPLLDYTPQDIQLMRNLYRTMYEEGSMDAKEYIAKIRMLTALTEREDLELSKQPQFVNVKPPKEVAA